MQFHEDFRGVLKKLGHLPLVTWKNVVDLCEENEQLKNGISEKKVVGDLQAKVSALEAELSKLK